MRKTKPLSFHIGGFFFSLGSNIIGEELEILLKFAPCCLFFFKPIGKLHGRHPKQQHAKEKEQINSRQEEADTKETRTKSTKRKSFVCTSTTTLLQTSSIFFAFSCSYLIMSYTYNTSGLAQIKVALITLKLVDRNGCRSWRQEHLKEIERVVVLTRAASLQIIGYIH